MNNKKPICITFSWTIWSGKSTISNYLSTKLNLPIFSNDSLRSEVFQDYWETNKTVHLELRNKRMEEVLKSGNSFIWDFSIDREWKDYKQLLSNYNYRFFLICIHSDSTSTTEQKWPSSLKNFNEHELFLNTYTSDLNLHITQENFKDRMNICYEWIEKII